jgi:hypothetical protein
VKTAVIRRTPQPGRNQELAGKFEIRSSRFETFGLGSFELVSDFEIRVSDLDLAHFAQDFARKSLTNVDERERVDLKV